MFTAFGTRYHAPVYRLDSGKNASWSSLDSSKFDTALQKELRIFILRKAFSMCVKDRVDLKVGETDNFFHHEFLSGWPHTLWKEAYLRGVSDTPIKVATVA